MNSFFFPVGEIKSSLCSLCEIEEGTPDHLFVKWEYTIFFYLHICELMEEIVPFARIKQDLTDVDIIFNHINKNPMVVSNFTF